MGITISFSPYCIGAGREECHLRKCECERCLTAAGKEVTEGTILSSKVQSYIQKYDMDHSITKIFSKSEEDRISSTLFDIRNLVMHLNWILEDHKK